METAGTATGQPASGLEAPGSTNDRLFLVKGGIFLGTVAAAGMLAGFITTLSLAKKKSPEWFNKLWLGPGWALAGSWLGPGWVLMNDFRSKMQSIFPTIPKNSESAVEWEETLKSK
uniref:Transmembrane protein 242 n=1 Tax=Gorilla gorilla gorilla TaxID=9595 RepID=G3QI78_GORGO